MRNLSKKLTILTVWLCVLCLFTNASAEVLKLPSGLENIEEEAFDSTGITCVEIPEGTKHIKNGAFTNNVSLKDVYFPMGDIEIEPDAFDLKDDLTFHAYIGTANADWVTVHDRKIEYITTGGSTPETDAKHQVCALISSEGQSALQDNKYGTGRLIVKLNPEEELPDLVQYNPKQIIAMGNDLYVIQFHNYTSARDCALTLEGWSGCKYVEADYFLSSAEAEDLSYGGQGRRALLDSGSYNPSDLMGFKTYTDSLPDTAGHVTVAVIDNGVTASQVDCSVSGKSYDFVSDRYTLSGNTHGTTVATYLCNSFGKLKNHLSIISYNVENHSNSKISYLLMGLAILQAKEDGADFINISIAGESSYSNEQDNEFLRECISNFGAGRIIAAGGNYASSVNNFIPAKYCRSVTGVKLEGTSLVRAGTATGADYGGASNFTSYAAPMVTAAFALLSIDPDPAHRLSDTLENVVGDNAKMPILSRLIAKPVEEIVLNGGEPVESAVEVGTYPSIEYDVIPSNADSQVNVTVEPGDGSVIEIVYHKSSLVVLRAVGPGTAKLTFATNDGNASPVVIPITVIQPVNSVKISGDTGETLMKDETLSLSVTVSPANATNPGIDWTSSDPGIATVSSRGEVTQVGSGTVTIIATSRSNPDIHDSVSLTVSSVAAASSVSVAASGGIDTLNIGKTAGSVQMNASVLPDSADQSVTWSVDKTDVATIDPNGLLTAVGAGEVIVTATSVSSGKKGYKPMTVVQLPTSISVTGDDMVPAGGTITLNAAVFPANAQNKEVIWSSSNSGIAAVDATGTVTGVASGTAIIFASGKADRSVIGQKTITVGILPTAVSIDTPSEDYTDLNETLTLSATFTPDDTTERTLTWSTSDSSVATVSNGTVTGKAPGTARITATTANGKTSTVLLTVRQPYTLVFDANGGTCSEASRTAYSGYAIGGTLPTPSKDYNNFIGWYTTTEGGTRVTADTALTSSTSVTVYARWELKEKSGWVLPGNVPGDAQVTDTSYSYRESKESTSSSLSGYTANGNYWKQTGTGSKNYASFPSGYNTSNTYYTQYNGSAYSASETTTTKRTVTNTRQGFIYWHWMYNVAYLKINAHGGVDRSISWKKGTFVVAGTGGKEYPYKYFFANYSTTDCPTITTGSGLLKGGDTNLKVYDCNSIITTLTTKEQRSSGTSGVGTDRFFRVDVYKSTYTDYQKIFKYYRDVQYNPTNPGTGSNISNLVTYVKYRNK